MKNSWVNNEGCRNRVQLGEQQVDGRGCIDIKNVSYLNSPHYELELCLAETARLLLRLTVALVLTSKKYLIFTRRIMSWNVVGLGRCAFYLG